MKPRTVRGFKTRMHADVWDPFLRGEVRQIGLGLEIPSVLFGARLRERRPGARFQTVETAQ